MHETRSHDAAGTGAAEHGTRVRRLGLLLGLIVLVLLLGPIAWKLLV